METFMIDALKKRRKGYLRTGKVKVLPIRRTGDWLPENADSAFMNTGAKVEYVVPRLRTGQLADPLNDLTDDQKNVIARQLGLKEGNDLNINIEEKKNFWINRSVVIDKDGLHLDLANIADFINYKILEVNLEYIAPSWEERYNKGTYKFALVFEDEEAKVKNMRIDTKRDAYMMFGKIDGSVKKLSDFLWIYYLTNKDGKRLPNNPSLEYLRGETGRIIEERPGEFLSIVTDPLFETKALIQKAINIGLIQKSGQMFQVFGEDTSKSSLEDLITYLQDDRNNNIRISLIGKIDQNETLMNERPASVTTTKVDNESKEKLDEAEKRLKDFEEKEKANMAQINDMMKSFEEMKKQNEELLAKLNAKKSTGKKSSGKKTKDIKET